MLPDHMDYRVLRKHNCRHCRRYHRLSTHPVKAGWIVAVVCGCKEPRTGLPRRYSTETGVLPTIEAAEQAKKDLLRPPTPVPNVNWHRHHEAWVVQFKRSGRNKTVGYFHDHGEAVEARNDYLRLELENAQAVLRRAA